MTSTTTASNDPFAAENYADHEADPLAGWMSRPDGTLVPDGPWFPGEDFPPTPDGYELVPGDKPVIRPVGSGPRGTAEPEDSRRDDLPADDAPPPREEAPAPPASKATKVQAAKPAAKRSSKRKPQRRAAKRVKPTTAVETRGPISQNDHTLCMINSTQLTRTPQLVAMVASVEIAISAARQGVPFADATRELTPAYIAGKTGLSEEAARTNMKTAALLGFLERVDDGRGGKRDANGVGANCSTWRARVPAYFEADTHNTDGS